MLSAGTFLVNNPIFVKKGITLRGAGPTLTKLEKTNGAVPISYIAQDQSPVIIVGPERWPRTDDATSVRLTQNAVAGSFSVTVANALGFAPGQFVLLDEDDYTTASWLPLPLRKKSDGTTSTSSIWGTDRVVFQKHNPPESSDDAFPASLTWFSRGGRPLNEIKEIVSVSGNTITFSTPIHAAYTVARLAELTRYATTHVRDAGVEDLAVVGGGNGNVKFEAAAYSWVKNVDTWLWLGDGISANHSFRVEIRDSYVHDTAWPQPGGGGYGLSLAAGSSEILIENNAVLNVNKVMVVRSCGAGSVVGYNYMDNGFIMGNLDWVEVGLNASHQVGSHHVLFEGNESWNYDSDNTHGNAFAMTIFRNHLRGVRRSFPGMSNARTAGLMVGSWWHSFIGNVLGEEGKMNEWFYEDLGNGNYFDGASVWAPGAFIWKLGYDPANWNQLADPKVQQTTYRDANFDYKTNQVTLASVRRNNGKKAQQAQALPASLYLKAKPAFFGTSPWPWVDPLGRTKLGVLPAKLRVTNPNPMYDVMSRVP